MNAVTKGILIAMTLLCVSTGEACRVAPSAKAVAAARVAA